MMEAMAQHSAQLEVDEPIIVYTVGHSNPSLERFLDLLMAHGIAARFSPQFNRDHLEQVLREAHVDCVFLGKELGGRPTGDEFFDVEGRVRYDRLAESRVFLESARTRTTSGREARSLSDRSSAAGLPRPAPRRCCDRASSSVARRTVVARCVEVIGDEIGCP